MKIHVFKARAKHKQNRNIVIMDGLPNQRTSEHFEGPLPWVIAPERSTILLMREGGNSKTAKYNAFCLRHEVNVSKKTNNSLTPSRPGNVTLKQDGLRTCSNRSVKLESYLTEGIERNATLQQPLCATGELPESNKLPLANKVGS